ncbi:hypothetical protein MCOR15_010717 [Pyricularia oryzae]|nr:hypothetical protein MCOR15_010717 [Pyricularia oryzae]
MAEENPTLAEYFPKELECQAVLNGGLNLHQPLEGFTQASGSTALATDSGYSPGELLDSYSSSEENTYLGSPAGSSQIDGTPSSNRLGSVVHYPLIIPSVSDTTLVNGNHPQSQDCSASTSSGDSEEALFMQKAQRLARASIRYPLELADSRYQPSPLPNGENHMNGGTKDNKSNPSGTDQRRLPSREPPFAFSSAPLDSLANQDQSTEAALSKPSTGSYQTSVKDDHLEPSQDAAPELSNEGDEIWTRQFPVSQRVNGLATRTIVFKTRAGNPVRIVNQPKQPFLSCRGLRVVNPDTTPNGGADYESSDDLARKPSPISSCSGTPNLNGQKKRVDSEESEESEEPLDKIYSSLSGNPKRVSLPIRFGSASTSGVYTSISPHFTSHGNVPASQLYSQPASSLIVDISSDSDESSSYNSFSAPSIAAIPSASQNHPEEKATQQNLDIKTNILGDQVAGTLDQLKTARWSLGLLWRTFFELLRMTFSLTLRITASTARGVGAIFQFDLRAFSSLLKIWIQFGQVVIQTFLASTLIVTIAVEISVSAFFFVSMAFDHNQYASSPSTRLPRRSNGGIFPSLDSFGSRIKSSRSEHPIVFGEAEVSASQLSGYVSQADLPSSDDAARYPVGDTEDTIQQRPSPQAYGREGRQTSGGVEGPGGETHKVRRRLDEKFSGDRKQISKLLGLRRRDRSPNRPPKISSPIGPVVHNGRIMSTDSTDTATIKTSYSFLPKTRKKAARGSENINPTDSEYEAHPRRGLAKSKTLNNVFSSISGSLSRGSLGSFGAGSRNVSGSSTSTTATGSMNQPLLSLPRLISRVSSGGGPDANIINVSAITSNPRLVAHAQPTSYWAGRFLSLHDRFHSEVLSPSNLEMMVKAQASLSTLENESRKPALQRTTVTSSSTLPDISLPIMPRKFSTNLPLSSSTILPSTETLAKNYNDESISKAALLEDEENRCRRIFLHLESLCLTREARASLHAFQQLYARKMRRPGLLPDGGTMEDRSLISRLIVGGRKISGSSGTGGTRTAAFKDAVPVCDLIPTVSGLRGNRLSLM